MGERVSAFTCRLFFIKIFILIIYFLFHNRDVSGMISQVLESESKLNTLCHDDAYCINKLNLSKKQCWPKCNRQILFRTVLLCGAHIALHMNDKSRLRGRFSCFCLSWLIPLRLEVPLPIATDSLSTGPDNSLNSGLLKMEYSKSTLFFAFCLLSYFSQ